MAIILKNGRALSANANAGLPKYERNKEYLDLPNLVDGDEKIYLLAKIYENANYFRLYATGDYQIDWGDGQGVQTYSSGTYADYEIDWNNISSSTVTTYGYRQAIITIEPQAGASLTTFICSNGANSNDPSNNNIQIVDCKMAGQNFTSFYQAFTINYGLEQFEFVGAAPNLINVTGMFRSCASLEKMVSLDTSNITNFSDFLSNCGQLIEVPKFDLSSATSVNNMFENNSRITYLEPYDLDVDAPNLTNLTNMFDGLPLVNVPITSASNITNFYSAFNGNKFKTFNVPCPAATNTSYMFYLNDELESVTTSFPNTITSSNYMFFACSKLKNITPFDTSNITNCSYMFYGTSSLKDVSWANFTSATDVTELYQASRIEKIGAINTSVTITSSEMFYNNKYIINPSSMDNVRVSRLYRIFRSCVNLERIPLMDVSAVTDIRQSFNSCYRITSFPAWDLSAVTLSDTNTFSSCLSLRESNIFGLTKTHSYAYTQLDRDAIVNVFNNLGTAVSQTIYVNGTPGAANLTAGDIAIATGKGWTVVQ